MMSTPELKRQIIVLLISLVASLVASVVPNWGSIAFSVADQVLLGVILFQAFILIDVLYLCGALSSKEQKEIELWSIRGPAEQSLACIRNSFNQLVRESYGDRDLFTIHFLRKVRDLEESIRSVSEKGELRVRADHFLNVDNVLDAFRGDAKPVWRYTWFIGTGEKLFEEVTWRRYFEQTAGMLARREIHEMRVLLVCAEEDVIKQPRIVALFQYFASHRGCKCSYMLQRDYAKIASDNKIPSSSLDFGIYGSRLLFITERYEPEIVGVFSKDKNQIEHYTRLFDSLWSTTAVAKRNPASSKPMMSLEELFLVDAN